MTESTWCIPCSRGRGLSVATSPSFTHSVGSYHGLGGSDTTSVSGKSGNHGLRINDESFKNMDSLSKMHNNLKVSHSGGIT